MHVINKENNKYFIYFIKALLLIIKSNNNKDLLISDAIKSTLNEFYNNLYYNLLKWHNNKMVINVGIKHGFMRNKNPESNI